MDPQLLIDITQNFLLLLGAALFLDVMAPRWKVERNLKTQVISGLVLGLIGVVLLFTSWISAPGVLVDTRSVLAGIVGLFFGLPTAVVTIGITAGFRIFMGGVGVPAGIALLVSTALVGVLWRRFSSKPLEKKSMAELYLFGLAVHVVMLSLVFIMPWTVALNTLARVALPVLLLYPLGTVLMGVFLVKRLQRRHTEEMLVSREKELSSIFRNVTAGIYRSTPEGRYLMVNPYMAEMFGYDSPEQMVSEVKSIARDVYLDPKDRIQFLEIMKSQGKVLNFEVKRKKRDGSVIWVSTSAWMIRDEAGEVSHYEGLVHDITERVLSKQILLESQAKLTLAMEVAKFAPWEMDVATMTFTFDDRFYALYATTAEREGGMLMPAEVYAREFVHPDELDVVAVEIDTLLNTEDSDFRTQIEHRIIRRDGEIRYIAARYCLLRDAQGNPIKTVGANQDITERKLAEQELLLAKEQAEASNRAKSEFLANMSHEIRTPLNGILGMLQLVQTTSLDAEQRECIGIAILSSNRLTRLISDILDLSRVEANRITILQEPFDLPEMVSQVCDLFKVSARNMGIHFECRIDSSIPKRLIGDVVRLQQVLNNLVGNAFKFTNQGSVQIEVWRVPSTQSDTIRVLFSVMDTGIGIPEDMIPKLFQPFTQGSEGYKREYQGAGLGLSICKRLVDLMNGNITIDSMPGEGTSVHFDVPLEVAREEAPAQLCRDTPQCSIASRAILLAEDDSVNRLTMVSLLKKIGHQVVAVENGQQALAELQKNNFDLVLMDIQMPVMNGVEATRAIRDGQAGKRNIHIPIIAITAYAMSGDRENFLDAGMDGYLAKPVEIEALRELLDRTVGEHV